MTDHSGHGGGGGGGHGGGGHGGGGDGEHGPAHGISETTEGFAGIAEGIANMIPEEEDHEGDGHGEDGHGEETDHTAEDWREGLETGAKVGETVAKGVQGLDKLGKGLKSGDFGDLGSGVGGLADAARYVVPEGEAQAVMAGVGQVARGVGQVVEGIQGLAEQLLGEAHTVHYHLEVDGTEVTWNVRSLHYEDAIGELPVISVEAAVARDSFLEETELFAKDVHVTIEREEHQRSLRGIIRRASVDHGRDEQLIHLEIAPAAWMMTQGMDSRVYQDRTVPALVEEVVGEMIGERHREVRLELTEQYPEHEYMVQHRETHWGFLSRLMDEEGIWWYFDHDSEDHEVLVLCDSNDNRPQILEHADGQMQYTHQENAAAGREAAFHIQRQRWMGPTDAHSTSYDWTRPRSPVEQRHEGRGEHAGPALEVHEHFHNVRHHGYDEGVGRYQEHTASRHAQHQTERLDLNRAHWSLQTTVIEAKPGHIFELVGADTHDGRYLITRVSGSGQPGAAAGGFHATLELVPADMPYRPPAPTRPSMPGPETATVVGEGSEEIYTDQYGRVKVRFHWDRLSAGDERSSAWIRVMQQWSGPNFGAMWIPRVGMEVIVSFLGGDPDRPVITGCLYNGENQVPWTLPDNKTVSGWKTNSSQGGNGSNELKFEDKKGSEEIYVHAEKDYNEVVEHCHTTHVKVDQTNTVDHDHTETVGNDQKLTVNMNRVKRVKACEETHITQNRDEFVHGSETVQVDHNREHFIGQNESLTVAKGTRAILVKNGENTEEYRGGRTVTTKTHDKLLVTDGANRTTHVSGEYKIKSDNKYQLVEADTEKFILDGHGWWESANNIKALVGKNKLEIDSSGKIRLQAESEIVLKAGSSSIKISPSGVEITGPSIKINGTGGTVEIDAASQVKIKC